MHFAAALKMKKVKDVDWKFQYKTHLQYHFYSFIFIIVKPKA